MSLSIGFSFARSGRFISNAAHIVTLYAQSSIQSALKLAVFSLPKQARRVTTLRTGCVKTLT